MNEKVDDNVGGGESAVPTPWWHDGPWYHLGWGWYDFFGQGGFKVPPAYVLKKVVADPSRGAETWEDAQVWAARALDALTEAREARRFAAALPRTTKVHAAMVDRLARDIVCLSEATVRLALFGTMPEAPDGEPFAPPPYDALDGAFVALRSQGLPLTDDLPELHTFQPPGPPVRRILKHALDYATPVVDGRAQLPHRARLACRMALWALYGLKQLRTEVAATRPLLPEEAAHGLSANAKEDDRAARIEQVAQGVAAMEGATPQDRSGGALLLCVAAVGWGPGWPNSWATPPTTEAALVTAREKARPSDEDTGTVNRLDPMKRWRRSVANGLYALGHNANDLLGFVRQRGHRRRNE